MRHNELYRIIDDQITPVGYEAFKGNKTVAVVAIDEELRFDRCIKAIVENEPDASFLIVAHARMYDYISRKNPDNTKVFCWKGRYDDGVADVIFDMSCGEKPDAFLYFSEQEMNRRDSNLIHVAEVLKCRNPKLETFCNSIGDELYRIDDPVVLNQAYKEYDDMSERLYRFANSE